MTFCKHAILALAAAFLCACKPASETTADTSAGQAAFAAKPNILLIVADDLGFSDIGPFGSEIATPNLDALAREGRILTSMYATPMPISRTEILTGADHHLVGWGSMYPAWGKQAETEVRYYGREINDKALVVAHLLKDAGYHTYMVGTWHLGEGEKHSMRAHGFDSSFALLGAAGMYFALGEGEMLPEGAHGRPVYRENADIVAAPDAYITDYFTDKMLGYIDAHKGDGKPFFAYAAYTSPHFPLQVTDEFIDRYKGRYDEGYEVLRQRRIARQKAIGLFPQDFQPAIPLGGEWELKNWDELTPDEKKKEARRAEIYAAMIENLDWNIGRLVQRLKDNGQYANTLIVFTSGNGAAQGYQELSEDNRFANLGRRGSWIYYTVEWAQASNAPFGMWKAKPREGGISVPAIVRLPGQKEAAPRSDAVVTIRDLVPTFLDVAGVAQPGDTYRGRAVQPIQGKSMLPFLQGRADQVHADDAVFADENSGEAYVRQGEWKAVLMTKQHTNQFEKGDRQNTKHIAALLAGDMKRAAELRARYPATWSLYNIRNDRGETRDLAAERPDVLRKMQDLYAEYRRTNGVVDPL
jgi:arylsulfatase